MIIYRQKEFASTKESRKKVKEANEKDKTRKALTIGQAAGVSLGAAGLYAGHKLSKKSKELLDVAGMNKVNAVFHTDSSERRRELMKEAEKLKKEAKPLKIAGKRLTKAGKVALGAGLGLGAVKIARDIKKKKNK